MTLKEALSQASDQKVALGHFNISSVDVLWGIFNAAKSLNLPIVIGLSEGEREFFGIRQARDLITSIGQEFDYPIFLNADHTYSLEKAQQVIDAKYDSLVFDAAKLPLDENITQTKAVVDYARANHPDMLLEAELGYIGSSSKLLDEIPEGATVGDDMMVKPEDAKRFVQETGVDLLAPAVGNIHGMLKNVSNPEINTGRVTQIKDACGVPLVLHGGSGISDDNFKAAISAGISMVHINTEIRRAWKDTLAQFLTDNPDEIAPYKILKPSLEAVQEVVQNRLKLFNNIS